jgi:hypothetical protein
VHRHFVGPWGSLIPSHTVASVYSCCSIAFLRESVRSHGMMWTRIETMDRRSRTSSKLESDAALGVFAGQGSGTKIILMQCNQILVVEENQRAGPAIEL